MIEFDSCLFRYILASSETFELFLGLSNSLDDFDKELINICTLLQTLQIPSTWSQSSLFDWKQVSC